MLGASELLNRYGRERCLSHSTISDGPDTYPPEAPPIALPSVPVMTSTLPWTPRCSGVPAPVSPMKPTACESSTITSASCASARSQMPGSGAR